MNPTQESNLLEELSNKKIRGEKSLNKLKRLQNLELQVHAIFKKEFNSEAEREEYAKEKLPEDGYKLFVELREKKYSLESTKDLETMVVLNKEVDRIFTERNIGKVITEATKEFMKLEYPEIASNKQYYLPFLNDLVPMLANKYNDEVYPDKEEEIKDFIKELAEDFKSRHIDRAA